MGRDTIPCEYCGEQILSVAKKCRHCGEFLVDDARPENAPGIGDDAGMRMLLPVGRSVWALASGYLGLMSACVTFLGPFALLTGILAVVEIKRDPKVHGMGRAVFGIVMGSLATAVLVAILVMVALDRF